MQAVWIQTNSFSNQSVATRIFVHGQSEVKYHMFTRKHDKNIVISDILLKKGWKNCTMKVWTSVKQFYLTIKIFICHQLWLIIYESQVMNFMMQKLNTVSPKILTCDSWVVNIVTNNVTNTDTSEYWHFRKVAERADLNRLTVRLTRI